MNELLARFWIGVVKLFRFVPIAARGRIAAAVGWILWLAIPKRRHVTLTNLRLCFPELSDKERLALAHSLYRRMARAAITASGSPDAPAVTDPLRSPVTTTFPLETTVAPSSTSPNIPVCV